MHFKHILWLDFETRSQVDLTKHGAYRYVDDPAHRILVAGYALDNAKPKAAIIQPNGALPVDLRNMLADKRVQVRAHNAAFDRLQLKGDAPPIERWFCTMAQARAAAMPGKLEHLGKALKTDMQKASYGTNLMRMLSIPDAYGNFSDDRKLMKQYADYCAIDVGTMREASLALPAMRDEDLRVYHASERINDRGMPIDTELCRLAVQYAADEKVEAEARVFALTCGLLTKTQGTKLTKWVWDRLDPVMQKHMETVRVQKLGVQQKGAGAGGEGGPGMDRARNRNYNKDGNAVVKPGLSLASDIRAKLLDIAAESPSAIDPEVVEVIEACEDGSLSSTAKFKTMLNRVSADGRLRGAFVFNGAAQTNRWSSTGAQVHNYPREVAKDPEAVLARMRRGERLNDTLLTLKGMLRPAITPGRGRMIVRCDWNAIEARGLPWLADNAGSREYMQAFMDDSRDIYVEQARAAGLGDARQPGKVVVLSLGYGGGPGALTAMAKNYGVKITNLPVVVGRWRKANTWVSDKSTGWWYSLGRCAHRAMASPGQLFTAGRVSLRASHHEGDKLDLQMILPSGRTVWYPQARVVDGVFGPEIEYLKAAWKPKKGVTEWPTARLWHGVLAENADQAMCADLLRDAVVRCEEQGIDVIGHVHDEIITEAPPSKAKAQGRKLQRCMLVLPGWAKGLPLKAEVDVSPRFRK